MFRAQIIAIIVIALIPVGIGAYWYVSGLQRALEVSRANEAKLQAAVATNEEAIRVLKRDFQLASQELQKVNGHENDCGRPGINGGFIDNPNVKFGVNCFGYKPIINSTESQLMNDMPLYPKTQKEINFDKKVNYWKTKIRDILIAPFNSKKWDMSVF